LRFGKSSPFDYLTNFIPQEIDCDITNTNGFFLFENISSISRRLYKSSSNWVIIPDSSEFGFDLLVNNFQSISKYTFFPIRSNDRCIFHIFIRDRDIALGENFGDVLNFFKLKLEDGLPQEEIVPLMDGDFPLMNSEKLGLSFNLSWRVDSE
jgi:hypothetical protein